MLNAPQDNPNFNS